MNGLAEFAKYLYEQGANNLVKEIDGKYFYNGNASLKEVGGKKYAKTLTLESLNGLFDYIGDMSQDLRDSKYIIQVESPFNVELYSCLDENREREHLISCKSDIQKNSYLTKINAWVQNQEDFLIWLRCSFKKTDERNILLKYCSTVEAASIKTYDGDGVTQVATVKNGIVSKQTVELPSEIKLCPYRTFAEIPAIESNFTFRMKKVGDNEVAFLLKEADGGKWKIDMMDNIASYIRTSLCDLPEELKNKFVVLG